MRAIRNARPGARRRDLSSRRRPGHAGPLESSAHAGAAAESRRKASESFFLFEYARVKDSCSTGCNSPSRNSGGGGPSALESEAAPLQKTSFLFESFSSEQEDRREVVLQIGGSLTKGPQAVHE